MTKLPSNGMPANLVDLAMMVRLLKLCTFKALLLHLHPPPQRAFAVWEKYADLKFVWQAEGCPDMEIRWEKVASRRRS